MALASSGIISMGVNKLPLTIISVTGGGTSVANAVLVDASSVNNGDIIIVSGASGTEQQKLNGTWMVSNTSSNFVIFSVYTDDIINQPSKNIIATGTYTTNLGTWYTVKKNSILLELGRSENTTINMNDANTRILANIVTPNNPISFSSFYSKYMAAAYIYSGNGDEIAQRYIFSTDSLSPMGSTTGNPFEYLSGTGNYETSLFGGGYYPLGNFYNNQTRLYRYSTDIRTVSDTLNTAKGYASAIGNQTYAFFAGGKGSSDSIYTIDRYTYSNDTFTILSGLDLGYSFINGSSVGNDTFGLFSYGNIYNLDAFRVASHKLTYATSALTTSLRTDSVISRLDRAASSGPTYGIFVGGASSGGRTGSSKSVYSDITKYTYGTNTFAQSGTSLSAACSNIGGSGNSTAGYFFNGQAGNLAPVLSTRKYNYSNDTLTSASTLVSIPYVMDATSSSPGGF